MSLARNWLAAMGALLVTALVQVAWGQAHLAFTADTQGHVGPCQSCPGARGLGSLARRQTMLAQLRQREPGLLLLDAGDALFGDESLPSGGKVIAAAYDALGYDAVNISYRDFRLGKAGTLSALQGAKFTPISANLLDADTGKPLFQPYVIKQAGGMKIAIVGATESPAALAVLPELGKQLAGIKIQAPADALAVVLPKAHAEAGRVVLLFYGSPAGVAPIRKQFGSAVDVILMGGAQPGELPAGGTPLVVATSSHGRQVADVTLTPGAAPQVTQWAVVGAFAPDPAMKKLVSSYPTGNAPLTLSAPPVSSTPVAQGPASHGLDRIDPGKTEPLNAAGRNSAVELKVKSVSLLDKLGDAAAPDGMRLLVIDAEFRNLQPPQMVDGQMVPAQYAVGKLADNLYGVGDDSRVLHRAQIDAAGLMSFDSVSLEKQNDTVGGKIVYEVPRDAVPHDVKLRFYDFAHGNIIIPILSGPFESAKPIAPPQQNQVVEAAIYGVKKLAKLKDQAAPAGQAFVQIELRARSTMVNSVLASGFDFHAAPGAKINVGTVADWTESRKYMQVVADGEHSYLPLPDADLPEAPRFLPDLMTGGSVAFLVPANSKSLELRCDFPNAALPDGTVIRGTAITFPIEGTRPASAMPPAIAAAKDEVFDVSIVRQQVAAQFGQKNADDGKKFLVIDVLVKNLGKQQEFFQPKEQLKYADASGGTSEWDEATLAGLYPPSEQMYIPPGERRAFQIAYQIDANETRPRIAYGSVTEGASKVLTLPALAAQVPAAQVSGGPTAAPAQPESTTPAPAAPQPSSPAPGPAPMKQVAVAAPAPDAAAPPADPAPAPAADTGPKPRPHGPAQGLAGVGITAEQVNEAIDKGRKALWEYCQKTDASENVLFGDRQEDVLVSLALVHADAHKKIPEFDAALRAYLTRVDPSHPAGGAQTYVNGLLCMLVQAYGDPVFEPKLRTAARWLVESQGRDGTWTYTADLADALFKQTAATGALQVSGGLPPDARSEVWKRLTPLPKDPLGGDNSCTQYALLGLQSAASSGIRLPPDLWQRSLDVQRARQGVKSGGWDYHETSEEGGYGSMTAAGICAVSICSYQMGHASFSDDPAVVHGLGWIDENFEVGSHPKNNSPGDFLYYWLYSVERVGRMLDTDFIGVHEWYPEGAAFLFHAQQPGGLWSGAAGKELEDARLASSFALLFLTRATPPLKPIERHGPGMLKTAAVAPNNRFYIILDCSGSMIDNMDGRVKFDIARGSVQALIDALPANSEVALRVYGHRKSALDPDCDLDTELKIPMGPLDKEKFTEALNSLRARGKTPLALSIQDAIQDLGDIDEKNPVTLLLLTDGGEDTFNPRGNPVKACEGLAKVKNLTFHIVGFDINQPEWSAQLQAMSQAAGARYWPAAHGADLERNVRNAVLGIPEQLVVSDADGHPIKTARFGDSVSLAPGKYRMTTSFAGRPIEQEFYISPEEITSITFDASQIPPGQSPGPAAPVATVPPTPAEAPAEATSTWPKFCTHCGAPLKPGQKFCSICGTKVVPK
jgi:hypothetical protein